MAKYGLNKVTLIGNLGADPELRYLDQGIALVSLSLACTERSRDKTGNYVDRTDWVDVNLWRSQAEIVGKYCRKGSTVYIEGRLVTRNWDTPEGEKRYKTEVQGYKVILLDGRPLGTPSMNPATSAMNTPIAKVQSPASTQTEASGMQMSEQKNVEGNNEMLDDDLPF